MANSKINKKIIKLNPKLTEDNLLLRADGRVEFICEHGVGHTLYSPPNNNFVHGCDGCCKGLKILKEKKK